MKCFTSCLTLSALLVLSAPAMADPVDLKELATYAKVSETSLNEALKLAQLQPKIIATMTKPSEAKPWWQYRKIFITTSRIKAAVNFYKKYEKQLNQASKTYGVPQEIICAILGVETYFGRNMGSWRVLDALYTLGFHYPKRQSYFSKEFANFVALCLRENWDITTVYGSYAGAMGMGQFMPSSYLNYAIDFDKDGHINLFNDPDDAIGSVANYFKAHGWSAGRGIYYPVHIHNADAQQLMDLNWKLTPEILYKSGATTKVNLSADQNIRLFSFALEDGSTSYAVGLNNFKTIMRYNTSPLYARAVYELAEFIRMEFIKQKSAGGIEIHTQGRQP